jgi:hypothetical protein
MSNLACYSLCGVTEPAGKIDKPEPRWQQIEKIERDRFGIDRWRPRFIDYLFITFTQSSTFGPTDAPLLGRCSKCLTMMQIAISLPIVIVLISRAVGVL